MTVGAQSGRSLGSSFSIECRNREAGGSKVNGRKNHSRFLASVGSDRAALGTPRAQTATPSRYPRTPLEPRLAAGHLRLPEEIRGHGSPQFPYKANWTFALVRDVVCGA